MPIFAQIIPTYMTKSFLLFALSRTHRVSLAYALLIIRNPSLTLPILPIVFVRGTLDKLSFISFVFADFV